MKVELPEKVNEIINTLMAAGYEAYAVGGCVRDSLLSRIPKDWDITTSAYPEQVKALFRRTIDTGIQHGTVTVMSGKEGFEVTTYRIDGEYEDGRHPKQVSFTRELSEDLRRRDFTINAMAYNPESGLVDLFGGQEDLNNRIIRCVGNPEERFNEDALRIMRAVRFAATLDYEIDEATAKAAQTLAPNLKKISAERIQAELTKLLTSHHPERLKTAYELGILDIIMPEFCIMMDTPQNNPHHCYNVGEHTLHAICNINADGYDEYILKCLRYGMLFHDMGKPACKTTDEAGIDHFSGHPEVSGEIALEIMRRLKFDNKSRDFIFKIVKYHDLRPRMTLPGMRKIINKIGAELAEHFETVQLADIMAQSEYMREEKLERLAQMQNYYRHIKEAGDALFLKDLKVNGRDILAEQLAQGEEIGELLNYLLVMVLNRPELNDKEKLMELARNYSLTKDKTGMVDGEDAPVDRVY